MDVRFYETRWDAFGGSPSESSAYKYGTQGVAIYARKPDDVLEAFGDGCATLTPRLKGHVRRLESGQVVEVRSDDPAAAEAIPAWSRLTGNPLLRTDLSGPVLRFYIQKK